MHPDVGVFKSKDMDGVVFSQLLDYLRDYPAPLFPRMDRSSEDALRKGAEYFGLQALVGELSQPQEPVPKNYGTPMTRIPKQYRQITSSELRSLYSQSKQGEGVVLEGYDLRPHPIIRTFPKGQFPGCCLAGMDLVDAKWYEADLRHADLSGADLRGAFLDNSVMFNADLHGANFQRASMKQSNLIDVDLHGADLRSVHLESSSLSGNTRDVQWGGAHLERVFLDDITKHIAKSQGAHFK